MGRRSTQYLKECIADALLILLQGRPLDKITADELTARAGVGRATYFRHFSSKSEVITFKLVSLWDTYAKQHDVKVRDRFDLRNARPFFQFNYSIRSILALVYRAGQQEALHEAFCSVMIPSDSSSEPDEVYRETFYAQGLYGLLDEWIRRDFEETPEEMARITTEIVGP